MHCQIHSRGITLGHRQLHTHQLAPACNPWTTTQRLTRRPSNHQRCLGPPSFGKPVQQPVDRRPCFGSSSRRLAASQPGRQGFHQYSNQHVWPLTSSNLASSNSKSSRSTSTRAAATPAAAAAATGGPSKFDARVVVIGGGPAGLATALMLARRGYTDIKVYERLPEPPAPDDLSVWGNFEQASERLYMIGLNGRGQAVLRDLDVMDRIDTASSLVLGRLDWKPDTPHDQPILTRYTTRTYKTRCIQRDRLASCILQELREKHGDVVDVEFNVKCVDASWSQRGGTEVCQLTLERQNGTTSTEALIDESSFVIGADGAGSALRDAMESSSSNNSSRSSSKGVTIRRYKDKNTIVYRTIPLFWPQELAESRPGDLNYSARTKSGVNMDCLPTKEGPFIGVMLYKPGDKQVAALKSKEDVRAFFQRNFPAFVPAIREIDLERFAQKGDSKLPTFSYAGPVLHHGDSACLVGDTIHTVKPYFGQGVNSAFEDVKILQKAFEDTSDDIPRAVRRYSELRSKDAEALVVLSHSLDGGFLTFVGPLILDSMLNKMLPRIFSPNIIASLQNEKWSFSQIRARKRVDRAMQVGLLAGVLWVVVRVLSVVLGFVGKYMGRIGMA